MGSYSSFDYEDIKVTDSVGLLNFLMEIKNKDENGGNDYMYQSFLDNLIDGKPYSFESWDSLKLISYWYKEQVDFLDKISKYIEGYVRFIFETAEEIAVIHFEKGETTFELGNMIFTKHKAKEFNKDIIIWKK